MTARLLRRPTLARNGSHATLAPPSRMGPFFPSIPFFKGEDKRSIRIAGRSDGIALLK